MNKKHFKNMVIISMIGTITLMASLPSITYAQSCEITNPSNKQNIKSVTQACERAIKNGTNNQRGILVIFVIREDGSVSILEPAGGRIPDNLPGTPSSFPSGQPLEWMTTITITKPSVMASELSQPSSPSNVRVDPCADVNGTTYCW